MKKYQCHECKKPFIDDRKTSRNQNVYCSRECASLGTAKVKNKPTQGQLEKWIKEKRSYESIGREFGVSGNAIKKWMKKEGLHIARIQPSFKTICSMCSREVKKEFNQRKNSHGQIKKRFFCNLNCSNSWEKAHGKLANVTLEEVLKMRKTMSIRAIARHFNVTHKSIIQRFNLSSNSN